MSSLDQRVQEFKRHALEQSIAKLMPRHAKFLSKVYPEGVKDEDIGSAYALIHRQLARYTPKQHELAAQGKDDQ